jgi:hypothetical protein
VITAEHVSFFPGHSFILLWCQPVDPPTKEAIAKFEAALKCATFETGDLTWEQARDEAFTALTAQERSLITASPALSFRSQHAV